MHVLKTLKRNGRTLAHGEFIVKETVFYCPKKCGADNAVVVKRQAALAEILPPRGTVGYDVIVFVGLQRYFHNRQRNEIRAALCEQYGLHPLSDGELSKLMRDFLVYFHTLHCRRAAQIGELLKADGGYTMGIDATGEGGRGTTFMCRASTSKRRLLLGAWKTGTENSALMIPGLQEIEKLFGKAECITRDLGEAVTAAADALTEDDGRPSFACHQHFLKDVGNDLLKDSNDEMRELIRRFEIVAKLKSFIRSLGRDIGKEIDAARNDIRTWLEGSAAIPDDEAGLAVVRAFAQWVADFHALDKNSGFPFDNSLLEFYRRATKMLRALESFIRSETKDINVGKALEQLHCILMPVRSEVPFAKVASRLEKRGAIFDRLRTALRLKEKVTGKDAKQDANKPKSLEERLAELRDVEAAVKKLTRELRKERPQAGPAQDLRKAIDIVLVHLDRHGPHLWGHIIKLPDGRTFIAERTNVPIEQFIHEFKHGERRRSGRKNLAHDLEQIAATALLVKNLNDLGYVDALCDGLDLARAFARLDAEDRTKSIPVKDAEQKLKQDADVANASLPKVDKNIIRMDAMRQRIFEESRRRAPKLAPRRRRRRKSRSPTAE